MLTHFKDFKQFLKNFKNVVGLLVRIHSQKHLLSQIREEEKRYIRATLYSIKEIVVTTGHGEQTVIVPNKAIDPTFDFSSHHTARRAIFKYQGQYKQSYYHHSLFKAVTFTLGQFLWQGSLARSCYS